LPAGPLALPAHYRVTLVVDGRRLEAPFSIRPDPRVTRPAADLAPSLELSRALAGDLGEIWRGYAEIGAVRGGIAARRKVPTDGRARASLAAQLASLDGALGLIAAGEREAPMSLKFAGEKLARLATDVEGADREPTAAQREVAARIHEATLAALGRRKAVRAGELPALNRALRVAYLRPITVPDAAHVRPAEVPAGTDLP
jgi:hypothetical protein